MSYDSVDILKHFAERAGITFPLLADPDYEIIDAFGIVNQGPPKDSEFYGFAYAGYYVVNREGVVTSKYFNEENNDRNTASQILIREFDVDADSRQGTIETDHLTLRWSASNDTFRPGQRGALVIEVEPKPGMHVYAPEVEDYIPVSWQVAPAIAGAVELLDADYPEAKIKHLPAIDESVPVYESAFRVVRDVRVMGGREFPPELQEVERLTLEGEFKYQACDAEKCYFPVTLPLTWVFDLEPHDLVRVPETIQRGAS